MKPTIISMFIVLIVMIAVPMLMFEDGRFVDRFGFFGGGSEKSDKLPQNIQQVVTDKKVEVYKWVDEHGVTQFGQSPPEQGVESEKITLSPDTNVVDALKIAEEEPEIEEKPSVFSLGSPYSPGGMKDLVEDSINTQEMLNQRQTEQEQMMQDLFGKKK